MCNKIRVSTCSLQFKIQQSWLTTISLFAHGTVKNYEKDKTPTKLGKLLCRAIHL